MQVTFWFLFALFAILAIILFSGRGGILIAGYNTASKEKQAKYDEKKLGRVTGSAMTVIAVMFLVMALGFQSIDSNVLYLVMGTVIVITCIITVVLCNTICRKR